MTPARRDSSVTMTPRGETYRWQWNWLGPQTHRWLWHWLGVTSPVTMTAAWRDWPVTMTPAWRDSTTMTPAWVTLPKNQLTKKKHTSPKSEHLSGTEVKRTMENTFSKKSRDTVYKCRSSQQLLSCFTICDLFHRINIISLNYQLIITHGLSVYFIFIVKNYATNIL
jgi:hypothetical protein